jgi:hypothetical protein
MKLALTSAMKRLSAVMLFCAIGQVVGLSSASAASATASGPSALAQLKTSIEAHQYVIAQANKQANEAALAVIAAEVDKLRLIEELHAAHVR